MVEQLRVQVTVWRNGIAYNGMTTVPEDLFSGMPGAQRDEQQNAASARVGAAFITAYKEAVGS